MPLAVLLIGLGLLFAPIGFWKTAGIALLAAIIWITPYELYLKFLYEYFRGELNLPDEIEDMYLPTGFKKLKYQEEAVLNARKVLDEYGGAFLSDVVGLGKTYMSALLAQHFNERCLVIAPPHLLDEHNPGSWPNVFRESPRHLHIETAQRQSRPPLPAVHRGRRGIRRQSDPLGGRRLTPQSHGQESFRRLEEARQPGTAQGSRGSAA